MDFGLDLVVLQVGLGEGHCQKYVTSCCLATGARGCITPSSVVNAIFTHFDALNRPYTAHILSFTGTVGELWLIFGGPPGWARGGSLPEICDIMLISNRCTWLHNCLICGKCNIYPF